MQPLLIVATLVGALAVAVNSETAYILAPVQNPRILSTGWGWGPVKTVSLALPSITRGWGWKPRPKGVSIGVYGGIRIGPKQQGWGQQQGGWGWQPQKQQGGWGWRPKQQGWGWGGQQQQQGWGWKQQGWGWDDDDDDEDDYRSNALELYDDAAADSSEEVADDDASSSVESEEEADDESAEADSPLDLRNSIGYEPIYV